MSVVIKMSAVATLAFVIGVGVAYVPVLALIMVAIGFIVALWSFNGEGLPFVSRPQRRERVVKLRNPKSTLVTKLVGAYLLLWWLALIAPVATLTPLSATAGESAESAAQGSPLNQLLILSFGLVGLLFLPAAVRRFDSRFRWVVALWVVYLSWASASLLWSVYPSITFRNVVAFILVSVGCFGLGAGFYGAQPNGRDLFLRHVFAAGVLSSLVLIIPLLFSWEQFHVFDPTFQLQINYDAPSYVSRPAVCALLVLVATSILGVRDWRRHDWLWAALLLLPLLVLKTRGPILFATLALVFFYFVYKPRMQDRFVQVGLFVVVGVGAYACVQLGTFGPLLNYLTLGRTEAATTLTGRTPLWDILLSQVGERPVLGSGFAAFFNPNSVFWIEQMASFPAVNAHNGYIEELLNTGLVGLTILLTFCLYAMVAAKRVALKGDPFGWLAFLFLIYFLLLNITSALIQSYLQLPFLIILTMFAIMASRPPAGRRTLTRAPNGALQRDAARRDTARDNVFSSRGST